MTTNVEVCSLVGTLFNKVFINTDYILAYNTSG